MKPAVNNGHKIRNKFQKMKMPGLCELKRAQTLELELKSFVVNWKM